MIAEKKKSLARNARVERNREGLLGEWKQIKIRKKRENADDIPNGSRNGI